MMFTALDCLASPGGNRGRPFAFSALRGLVQNQPFLGNSTDPQRPRQDGEFCVARAGVWEGDCQLRSGSGSPSNSSQGACA